MIEQYKDHLKDISGGKGPFKRKQWFTERFDDVKDLVKKVTSDKDNKKWVSLFTEDPNPRPELSKLQSKISRMAGFRKAVLDDYVAAGSYFKDGIDAYRYSGQFKESGHIAMEDAIKQL